MCHYFSDIVCVTGSALITLILTFIHLVVAATNSVFATCEYRDHTPSLLVYATYFHHEEACGKLKSESIFPPSMKLPMEIVFPNTALWAHVIRTSIEIYCVIDVIWILQSFILLFAAICRVRGFWVLTIHTPWCVTGIITLCFDICGTIFFGIHLLHLHDITDWLEIVGVEDPKNYKDLNKYITPSIYRYPSLDMLLKSSRYFVFLVIDFVVVLRVARAGIDAYRGKNDENMYNIALQVED